MSIIHPFMARSGEQKYITENYVSIPPALVITDEAGAIWTLGFITGLAPKGEYAFNVLRNGVDTGEFASRIERRKSEIWIFGAEGWKRMKVYKSTPLYVYGIKVSLKSQPIRMEPVVVDIYWDNKPEQPAVSFAGNPNSGLVWKDLVKPIECFPDQWLYAIVNPRFDMSIVGYIGNENLRAIPIKDK